MILRELEHVQTDVQTDESFQDLPPEVLGVIGGVSLPPKRWVKLQCGLIEVISPFSDTGYSEILQALDGMLTGLPVVIHDKQERNDFRTDDQQWFLHGMQFLAEIAKDYQKLQTFPVEGIVINSTPPELGWLNTVTNFAFALGGIFGEGGQIDQNKLDWHKKAFTAYQWFHNQVVAQLVGPDLILVLESNALELDPSEPERALAARRLTDRWLNGLEFGDASDLVLRVNSGLELPNKIVERLKYLNEKKFAALDYRRE